MIQQDHLQVFDLTLKTQSPLFVGSGRKIGKREYIYSPNQGCVKILNMELFFDYMLRHDLVRQFEKFMLSSNSSLLDFWTRDCHLAEDWLEHPKLMGDKPLIQYRLAVTEDVAGYNGTKEIHQFQRDAYGRAYIPGSSLKGALRTAWLVHLLHETPAPLTLVGGDPGIVLTRRHGCRAPLTSTRAQDLRLRPAVSVAPRKRSGRLRLIGPRCPGPG